MAYTMEIPRGALFILEALNQLGHKAYVVGGCVRDSILGRIPEDWDIATSAEPLTIKSTFIKTIDTGLKHGTITVVIDHQNFEVTTFRKDGIYSDNRRPDDVTFTTSLESDLSRRDFTVNAIAYHPHEGFIDPFFGAQDIKAKILRTVGNPTLRFQEDALRMLRAIRFSAQLDFSIDTATLQSIKENATFIRNISQERVRMELTKILISSHPAHFQLLHTTGLLAWVLPEFEACFTTNQNNPYHIYNVANHTLTSVSHIENEVILRWTMLLHDIGKTLTKTTDDTGIDHFYGHPIKSVKLAEVLLKRLKFDNKSMEKICRLIKHHDVDIKLDTRLIRKAIRTLGDDIFLDILKIKEADIRAQNPQFLTKRLVLLEKICKIYSQIKENAPCLTLSDLAVNGQDIINIGVKEGRKVGKILNMLLNACLDEPALNTKEKLLQLCKSKGIY